MILQAVFIHAVAITDCHEDAIYSISDQDRLSQNGAQERDLHLVFLGTCQD